MTADEYAAEHHEFSHFQIIKTMTGKLYQSVCHCRNWQSSSYVTRLAAKRAHERHQYNAELQRAYQ